MKKLIKYINPDIIYNYRNIIIDIYGMNYNYDNLSLIYKEGRFRIVMDNCQVSVGINKEDIIIDNKVISNLLFSNNKHKMQLAINLIDEAN